MDVDIELLRKQFARIGARVRVSSVVSARQSAGIDIGHDTGGEYFVLRGRHREPVGYDIIDVQPKLRHLLLLTRREHGVKEKYLCGHDERHWFVCAVPGASVRGVITAMEALQPPEVRELSARTVRTQDRLRRHTVAFVRQGEWFFIPAPELCVDARLIQRNEPISRGTGSKPHWCQLLYRHGGETVMVCRRHPNGVSLERYHTLLQTKPEAAAWGWRAMRRNATVYARGRISHPDHQTLVLVEWHRVLMNTEHEAPGKQNVVFLD